MEARAELGLAKKQNQMGMVVAYLFIDYGSSMRATKRHILSSIKKRDLRLYSWPQSNVYSLKEMGKFTFDIKGLKLVVDPTHRTKCAHKIICYMYLKSKKNNKVGIYYTDVLRLHRYCVR